MARKQTAWKTKGMNRDLSVSAFNPEFAFENMNLRLSTNEGNTTMSWVNEKGTLPLTIDSISFFNRRDNVNDWEVITDPVTGDPDVTISGIPLGTAVLNHQLILFVHDSTSNSSPDYIYKFVYVEGDTTKTHMEGYILYNGNLGFDTDCPIETLVSYESENVQKVYWTDNKNQPRLINIAADLEDVVYNDTSFDFVCELSLNETITVEKKLNANGMFAPGVIQYAFTYYHKNGQESNIFYTTPLYYISYSDRGASPEQKVVENAFKINIENVDTNFEYLRIYSIQRTSLNGTPTCKRVQDIYIKDIQPVNGEVNASYLDTGTSGDIIDPTELLFKGGEEIVAKTMEQKDNTLFLGNIKMKSHVVNLVNKTNFFLYSSSEYRTIYANNVSSGSYQYANQLTSYAVGTNNSKTDVSVPCAGFKYKDYYRCGVQFQDKTGRWSEPVFLQDVQVNNHPYVDSNNSNIIHLPIIRGQLEDVLVEEAIAKDYVRVRAVVVYPKINDRVTLCQGVVCPTVNTSRRAVTDKDLQAQSSWFFRPYLSSENNKVNTNKGTAVPVSRGTLVYTDTDNYMPQNIKRVEIEGVYDSGNKFGIDITDLTFHSPDLEYDESMQASNFTGLEYLQVGQAKFSSTLSDIDIQTETPTISSSGSGFIHKSFVESGIVDNVDYGAYGIVAGLFYDDYVVDDDTNDSGKPIEKWKNEKSSVKWMVYPWNKNGSLNNDINRPADKGTASALLKKKVISNLRYSNTVWGISQDSYPIQPVLFNSDEEVIVKSGDKIYQGNIDVLLYPDYQESSYLAFGGIGGIEGAWNIDTPFTSDVDWKTLAKNEEGEAHGLYKYETNNWIKKHSDIGNAYADLVLKKEGVRMKYKSTPHLFFSITSENNISWTDLCLPVLDIRRANWESIDPTTLFGGRSKDAFRENVWIPCGEPVRLDDSDNSGNVYFYYSYGDTYYQRWDCLKTYPFTREDPNQIVEIGSFMLETRANIDGRYDRNRGQINNLNMSPVNFNLYNPVYSQLNNFFSYRITETDEDNATEVYPNQVTWTVTKQSDSDVDPWTTITLASVMELDGNKGSLNKLVRFNDQLIAFQDTGISQILYNENIQISSADGVPIEIANSGKVQGKRYLSNSIGCTNKWALTTTPSGIYFMDSNDKGIYMFNGQLQNLSVTYGFNSWAKKNIPTTISYTNKDTTWDPLHFNDFVAYYDQRNQDVLFINNNTALAFSEKLGVFTSFYDYGNTPFLCNFEDTGIWIRTDINQQEHDECKLYRHNAGSYCNFFGIPKPYWMTLIGNPEPQMDKIFTNLEFRACVDGDGTVDQQTDKFTPTLPFDSLETWNEYQHGITTLSNRNGHAAMKHHTSDGDSSLKRKFRIWRCDIPRDNATAPENDTERNIYRKNRHPLDRMRNPWLYLKLLKNTGTNNRTEVHDIMMTYFG